MLRPSEIDAVLNAARRNAARVTHAAALHVAPVTTTRLPPGARRAQSLPGDASASGTGINHWWRYQEQAIPGGGRVMVNVGTGNLLIQDDDMLVPHKGIAMAFRRTYNSQRAAATNPDMFTTGQSVYGNGWTNTFDAHMVALNNGTVRRVYDVDGAAYDYTIPPGFSYGPGVPVPPPPGQHATLASDGGCGWVWTKPNGTSYYFYLTNSASVCPQIGTLGAYSGKLHQIIGRNRNTYLTFTYSWDNGDFSASGKVNRITVQAESGQTSTLAFADVNGRRLLQTLTFPDNATTVQYSYDANGNLTSISRPPNNAGGTRPTQMFAYQTIGSDSVVYEVGGPRVAASCAAGNCYTDGGGYVFNFNGSSAATSTVSAIQDWANVNPTIPDGTGAPLQNGYSTSVYQYKTDYYTTGVSQPTFRDTDGHMTNWIVDGAGRPTQTQECTASINHGTQCTGTWLTTNETWDANNNLLSQVDPRGNETDYAYDANGNVIEVGLPLVTNAVGTYKPTQLFDYDAFNNMTAYCDFADTHAAGMDWNGPPAISDNLCSSHVATRTNIAIAYPSSQPYGEATTITQRSGYSRHYVYDPAAQGGLDYGLPTQSYGDPFSEIDGTTVSEQTSYTYDANGNVATTNHGNGTTTLQRDSLGRPTQATDADGVTLYRAYYPDGSLQYEQDSAQHAAGVADTDTYDLDGNQVSETTHFSNKVGVNQWFYDGAGRLVETLVPSDQSAPASGAPMNYYAYAYMTRQLYDLTAGGQPSALGSAHTAHGNVFATQEYIPVTGTPAWNVLQAMDSDALDRTVATYRSSSCADPVGINAGAAPCSRTILTSSQQYDASPQTYGLLSSTTNSLGQSVSSTYDSLNRVLSVSYGSTVVRSFAYGANGDMSSDAFGSGGGSSYSYDVDGNLTTVTEAAFSGYTSPATVTNAYYPNGWRKTIAVSSAALTASPLLSYAYGADGRRALARLSYPAQYDFTTTYTGAGRPLTNTSPYSSQEDNFQYNAYGQPTQRTTPEGTYSGLTYDGEGRLAGFVFGGTAFTMQRDLAGELLYGTGFGGGFAWNATTANGVLLKGSGATSAWDALNHVVLQQPQNGYTQTVRYDNALRQAAVNSTNVINSTDVNGNPCSRGTTTNSGFGYDSENRTTSSSQNSTTYTYSMDQDFNCIVQQRSVSYSHGYTFNARNNLALASHSAGIFTPSESVHRDPDAVVFTSTGSGGLNRIWIGGTAFYDATNGTLNVYQRDMSGRLLGIESPSGRPSVPFIHWPYDPDPPAPPIDNVNTNQAWALTQTKADATTDGFVSFAGQRTVNNDTNSWTTPDAFAGFPSDPFSQQAYIWNRNDPYTYSDPSGFSPQIIATADPEGGWLGMNHVGYPGYIYEESLDELSAEFDVASDDLVLSDAIQLFAAKKKPDHGKKKPPKKHPKGKGKKRGDEGPPHPETMPNSQAAKIMGWNEVVGRAGADIEAAKNAEAQNIEDSVRLITTEDARDMANQGLWRGKIEQMRSTFDRAGNVTSPDVKRTPADNRLTQARYAFLTKLLKIWPYK